MMTELRASALRGTGLKAGREANVFIMWFDLLR